jgi:hypothetical protein
MLCCQFLTSFLPTVPVPLSSFDTNILQQDFSRWPDEPFEEMDSTLAVQQYIQQQIRREPSNIDLILTPPDAQDEGVWKYEHLR